MIHLDGVISERNEYVLAVWTLGVPVGRWGCLCIRYWGFPGFPGVACILGLGVSRGFLGLLAFSALGLLAYWGFLGLLAYSALGFPGPLGLLAYSELACSVLGIPGLPRGTH